MTDDITENNHGGDPLSAAANASTPQELRRRTRLKILSHVRGQGDHGATCEEVEDALGMAHQSASARISELRRDGLLIDIGGKRPTRTGRSARVHHAARAEQL